MLLMWKKLRIKDWRYMLMKVIGLMMSKTDRFLELSLLPDNRNDKTNHFANSTLYLDQEEKEVINEDEKETHLFDKNIINISNAAMSIVILSLKAKRNSYSTLRTIWNEGIKCSKTSPTWPKFRLSVSVFFF